MEWIHYYRSQGDFILAQFRSDPDLYHVCLMVQCFLDNRILTVADILQQCSDHHSESMIPDSWRLERKKRVLEIANTLSGISKEALLLAISFETTDSETSHARALDSIQQIRSIVQHYLTKE